MTGPWGKHGCGTRNDNGERLIDFCNMNNLVLVIGGTLFPGQHLNKLTQCSPDGRDKNQIDHLMINSMWKRPLLNIRMKTGADVGSDHHLVTAFIKLKQGSAGCRMTAQRRFDAEKLWDPRVKSVFVLQVENRFQALQNLWKGWPLSTMRAARSSWG